MPIAAGPAKSLCMVLLGVGFTALAMGAQSLPPLVVAVRRGDCAAAVKLANAEGALRDDRTLFVAGRMLDEGLCVKKDAEASAGYYARAADLGNRNARLDYATKVGLGEGSAQSYEVAGDTCRKAGFDPQGRLSQYSLGYACTVLGVAGRQLRETLPQGAFLSSGDAARVEFSPASPEIRIISTPKVGRSEAVTGSLMTKPLVDAQKEIKKAWSDAMAAVPKPDATRLDSQSVELALDVDMTLEAGREAAQRAGMESDGGLLQGDIRQAARAIGH